MKNNDLTPQKQEFFYDVRIDCLKKVLCESNIPPHYYNVNGFCDETICLELSGKYWIVYHGERGNKYEITEHTNLNEACIDMLKRLSPDCETSEKLIDKFHNSVQNFHFTVLTDAENYLRSRKLLAALKTSDKNVSDSDIINMANQIYKHNTKG